MKGFTIFLLLMIFCISCKNFNSPPQVDEDDLIYYLSNSWEVIATGTGLHSLEPKNPNENIKKGKRTVDRKYHYNIIDEKRATRFSTYTLVDNDEKLDKSTPLDTLTIVDGEMHSIPNDEFEFKIIFTVIDRKDDKLLGLFSTENSGVREPQSYIMYKKVDRVKYEDAVLQIPPTLNPED